MTLVSNSSLTVWQKTGSCVWAGGHCALQSTIAAQRVAATNPTKAFMPFTLHNYAASRHRFGDDSQGEGSMGSTFFASLDEDGVAEWRPGTLGMPQFNHADSAVGVTRNDELAWSSWRNHDVQSVLQTTKANTIASMGECKYVSDARSMLVNGYGVTFACNNYIGNARVEGSGADACLIGYWDSYGPHQQSLHAVWEHPNFGPLYWAQNNWPSNTYPRDPAGGPVCGCWVREAKVESAMRNLDSEVFGLSHLDWFPAQPKLLDWTP